MKIAAVCCTYHRPQSLGEMIYCFLRQDYPAERRELIILDDAGQYEAEQHDRWRLVSTDRRYPSLGEKRNAAAALVSDDVDALAVWDDDDLYLPWALSTSAAALERAEWSCPSRVLLPRPDGTLVQHLTGGLYHGAWAYRRELFEQLGGYPAMNNGEDQSFSRRLQRAGVAPVDPLRHDQPPFYVYATQPKDAWHLSHMGRDGYERLGVLRPVERQRVAIRAPLIDIHRPRIMPGVRPRPF